MPRAFPELTAHACSLLAIVGAVAAVAVAGTTAALAGAGGNCCVVLPEPSTLALLALGAGGVALLRARRQR